MEDQPMNAALRPVVAIDGPAGSGKSSTARAVATRLGYAHLDTGAWYRVLTWIGLRRAVEPTDARALNAALDVFDRALAASSGADRLLVDGIDVTDAIRTPEVSRSVSRYSSVPAVRDHLNRAFRRLAATTAAPGLVVEGRDITTVTFPDAAVRILLTASVEARARRRAAQLGSDDVAGIAQRISERDARDLAVVDFANAADGVTLLDTSDLTLDEVTEAVADLATASPTKEHHE